jgi:hypothetical protein
MEINFIIPNELKYLEGLVKLIRKKEMKWTVVESNGKCCINNS